MEASASTQVETGNLVLKTRIAVLKRNLEEVQRALEAVQQRRSDLREMVHFRRQVDKVIGTISRALDAPTMPMMRRLSTPQGDPQDAALRRGRCAPGRISTQLESPERVDDEDG